MNTLKVVAVLHGRLCERYEGYLPMHWPEFVRSFAEQCNGTMTHFSANYFQKPVGLGQCSTVAFQRGWKGLLKQLECGNVQGLDCWNMPKKYVNAIRSARFGVYFEIEDKIMTVICMADCGCLQDDVILRVCGRFDGLALEFREFLAVDYGYMFSLPADSYPVCFAMGFPHADATREMKTDAAHWKPSSSINCVRNVYPVNLLNTLHLSRSVQGLPLSEWIEAGPNRGALTTTKSGLHRWSFVDPLRRVEDLHYSHASLAVARSAVQASEATT